MNAEYHQYFSHFNLLWELLLKSLKSKISENSLRNGMGESLTITVA